MRLGWPKWKNKPTFTIKTFKVRGTKMALFLHFGPSKPLKQPKTPHILSQNRAKTTGLNVLGPMPNHLF